MKLFIGNLPKGTKPEDLQRTFERYGTVLSVEVFKNYAFLYMAKDSDAQNAIVKLHQTFFFGNKINVELSRHEIDGRKGDFRRKERRGSPPGRRGGGGSRRSRSPLRRSEREEPRLTDLFPGALLDARDRDLPLPPLASFPPLPLVDTPLYTMPHPVPRTEREIELFRDWYLRGLKLLDSATTRSSSASGSRAYEDMVREFPIPMAASMESALLNQSRSRGGASPRRRRSRSPLRRASPQPLMWANSRKARSPSPRGRAAAYSTAYPLNTRAMRR